jgi:xylose dehydrogenase (NAD/NADP)
MTVPFRFGLLSTARINDKVLAAAAASDRVEIAAVASRDGERARGYAAEHGLARAHGSYEALLADPEVDAVYISLPNGMHVDWSIRALEAGKHVLCEKPLTAEPAEAARAFDAAERTGRLLTEAFMWRHNPQTAKLAELVAAGVIGELVLVRSCFGFDIRARSPEDVRLQAGLEGGALMDVGCYCVSASRLLAGEPELASGFARERGGVDVLFAGTLRHPGGVLAQFECGFVVQDRHDVEAVGTEGSLFLADPFHARSPGIELRRGAEIERIEVPRADSYRLELENLADAARGRAPLLLGREDALGQARAIGALYRAAAEGRPVPTA